MFEYKLEEEINNIKENIRNLGTSIKGIKDDLLDPDDAYSKLIELEDISKRNNLHEVKEETQNQTWEDCETKI